MAEKSSSDDPRKDRLPQVGEEIVVEERRYKLISPLGEGGYGSVFLGKEAGDKEGAKQIAIKTEKYSKSMLHIEVAVLKVANPAKCKHFTELIEYGSVKPEYVYMMMTLLYKDLHRLRNETPDRKFTFGTAIRLAIQSLKGIEELHKIGFISRDVKPGNFAPGIRDNRQHKIIFMYDFGLAKKFVDKNNNPIPSRGTVGWRGTARYGSLNAHERQDLCRKDDLESWLYMIVEMTRGTLPWVRVSERPAVMKAKTLVRTDGRTQFFFECPKQYDTILTLIDAMQFLTVPEYDKILKLLEEARDEKSKHHNFNWDWEDLSNSTTTNTVTSYSEKELRANITDGKAAVSGGVK